MKIAWTKGLDKEQAQDVRGNYKEALVMRRRLVAMLRDRVDASAKAGRSKDLYDTPNWAYLQADARGYERAISEIIEFILEE